jgi:hypothetical protein
LSEGRKAFAKRLAGIEAGAECDRLAPQLSALADGEASAEDVALLRPHLRTCLVCPARLRDYRAAPARVAAMTPPVAAGGLLAGARELIAAIGVRWHQAAELAAANKVAAVVASTAVLAGGGAATVATVDADHKQPGGRAVSPLPTAERPLPAPRSAPAPPKRGRARPATPVPNRPDTAPPEPPRSPAPTSNGEFAPDAGAEASADSGPSPDPASDEAFAGGGEFAP